MRKKRNSKKLRASALSILLAGSMMLGMVPGGMGQVYAADADTPVKEEQTGFLDKAKDFFSDMGDGITDFFAGDTAEAEPAAALDEKSIVDADTSQGWQPLAQYTTENIGRIWTDKSVYNESMTLPGIGDTGAPISITKPEESDFMVGLSALSSTSNTSVTTQTPLDIVLVLDVSGSMSGGLGEADVYNETYNVRTDGWTTYYALGDNGEYVEIERVTRIDNSGWWPTEVFDRWELNGVKVEPKTRNDNNQEHIQFYTRSTQTISKIDGLKTAVNGFIDATAKQNESIVDPAKQHHISVVKYAMNAYYNGNQDSVGDNTNRQGNNYSQIVSDLTGDMSSLKNSVNGLEENGATAADYGMNLANRVLDASANHGAREAAQKVVVLFTDGDPNHQSGFDTDVANDAITRAKTLKDAGTLVYTVGVVSGANPNANINTGTRENINAYLHSVSSNYPDATGWGRPEGGSWSNVWRLGDRAEDSDFYKAATNSEELNGIFQEISEEINTGTGYPTETEDGFANEDGYVTFHDQLGDYMKVDSFNTLVLEDQSFTANQSEEEGGVIKYTYSGNAGEGKDVSNIVITVTPGTGSTGDTVDVSIPAALLPLRHFQVDMSEKTMTVTDKYPLRLFYNASLRDEAKESLANPDQDMKNYIAENSDEGKVYFYSNKYTESKLGPSENTTLGDTVATFEPATGNSFYYFTENTFLFADKELTTPVTSYNVNGTEEYWYAKTYYKVDNETTNGVPEKVTEAVSFRSHPMDEVKDWVDTAINGDFGEQYYIKAGAPRLTRIDDLTLGKGDSAIPNTATEVIAPNWDDDTNQKYIEVSLGNNGRLAVELPGTLEIKKTVTSEVTAPEKDFNFKLSLTNAEGEELTGEFDAQKFDAQGKESGETFKVKNGGVVALKDGESVKVYGLSNGDLYNIEETDLPDGFKTETNSIEGAIVGNEVTTAEFVNTYEVTPAVLEGDSSIRAQKILTDRDWKEGDSFNFRLLAPDGAPLPEGGDGISVDGNAMNKEVTDDQAFSFGKITFEKPGTYTYFIFEPHPSVENELLGVSYSDAFYRVEVEVTDNGEGALSATSTMTQRLDDQGQEIEGEGTVVKNGIAVFTNTFAADSVQWGVTARKEYVDNSGAKPLKQGDFTFRVETVVNDDYPDQGPLPGGADRYEVTNGLSGNISFGQATFDTNHDGKTYLYKITEVVPEGVTAQNPTKDGMTYDTSVYYLKLSIDSKEDAEGNAVMTVTPEYLDENQEVIPDMDEIVFRNEYTPTPVVIGGDDVNTAIKGTKTLTGRAMKDGEFEFELTAANDAAIAGLNDDSIVFEGDTEKATMTAKAPTERNGESFKFGSVKFTKPGIYTFNMKEVIPEPKAGGMTYDSHTEVVTVTVTDKNGVLTATTTYDNDGAAFENTYEAFHSYIDDGAAIVKKTLNGRNMKAGEFDFTITGTGDNAEAADEKLEEADKAFQNAARRDGVANEMQKLQNVQFTEADAGQTFTYLIDEVMPEEADRAGGVTYDQSEYTLAITVTDDGDGTMSTSTTVSRVKALNGTTLETPEVLGTYTAGKDVVAVPFVNTYKAGSVTVDTSDVETGARLRKQLNGRAWAANESFSFTMSPVANGEGKVPPMPVAVPENGIVADENGNLVATVTADAGTPSGTDVYFGFGSITYEEAGTYVYTVKENVPDPVAGGMTYSTNVVTITVTVTDPGTGTLEARLTAVGSERTRRFINTYDASLNLGEAGGLAITKTLNGHDLAAEQFTFKVKAVSDGEEGTATVEESAELFGFNAGETEVTFQNPEGAADGTTVTMLKDDTEFTLENVGKTYQYEVSEVHPEGVTSENPTKDGYTYDTTTHTLALEVTDDGDGTLTLHAKVDDTEVTKDETTADAPIIIGFNNTYAATGNLEGEKDLIVEKILDGRDWIESDSFSFKLKATEETVDQVGKTVTLPDNASKLVIDGKDEDHKAAFGNITFTKPGKYTFAVSEVVPEGAVENKLNGITYDTTVKNITVNVTEEDTENGNGKLVAAIADGSDKLEFTNTYAVSTIVLPEDLQFKATKTLVGRDWTEADAFEFKLTPVDDAPMPADGGDVVSVTKDAQTATFGTITYSKAGTYEYQIKETIPENKEEGMTYDTHTATVIVEVTENFATGTLSVKSVTYSDGEDGAQFTNVLGDNTKEVTSGDTDVNNGMIGVGDELTYTINWVNDGVDENGKPADAIVTITDTIPKGTEYVKDSAKDAVYDEAARTLTWTIDAKAAETGSVSFKVVVTEAAGGEAIENQGEIKVGKNDPKVTNKVQTTVPGKTETSNPNKIEEGTILNYEISFVNVDGEGATAEVVDNMTPGLEYQIGTAMVGDTAVEPTVAGDAASGQTLTWNLEGLAADAKVTITFDVKVTRDALDSVDNSATVNGHKSNVVTTPYPSDDKKTVEDENGNDQDNGMVGVGDKLIYTIDWAADEAGKVIITDKVPTGTKFVSVEDGGVHEGGTVTWTIEDAKKGQKGSVSFTVEVTGEVSGDYVLNEAEVKVGDNDPKVTNEVETFIPGKDSALEGEDTELQVGDKLTYTISYKNPEDTAATVTITDIIPEGLDYVDKSAGEYAVYDADTRTLTWTLTDVAAGAEGEVTFEARVNESAETTIENKATIEVGENSPKYDTDTDGKELAKDGNLAISKTIALTEGQGTAIDTTKEFTFTVDLKDTAGKGLTEAYAYTIKNGEDKEVSGSIVDGGTLVLKHGEKATINGLPSGAQFTVKETAVAGYTSDKENNAVTGTIPTDDTVNAEFTNTYSATEVVLPTEQQFKVTKTLTGRDWKEGETFTFTLTGKENAPMPTDGNTVTVTEDTVGTFETISYGKVGTYEYTITENVPDGVTEDSPTKDGITYDLHEETVTVVVKDDFAGNLEIERVTYSGEGENAQFTNTYSATTEDGKDVAADIAATKTLTGRDMTAGDFGFEVVIKGTDTVVAEGTNAAAEDGVAGAVAFAGGDANGAKPLTYTTESLNQAVTEGEATEEVVEGKTVWTVNYTAREKTGEKDLPKGVTPVDGKTAFDFTVKVTDNADGTLTAEVEYPNGAIAFENTYSTGGTTVNTDPTEASAYFNKVLTGRDWLGTDEFTFTIAPQNGAPAPEGAANDGTKTVTVTSEDAKADTPVAFGFGNITFTDADMEDATANEDGTLSKTFTYLITENDIDATKMPGVTKDEHPATLEITVTDNQEGELSAAVGAVIVENGTFTNKYASALDYNDVGGLQIMKVLQGRDLEQDQFTFEIKALDTESAEKFGFEEANKAYEFKNKAAAADVNADTKAVEAVDIINVLDGKTVTFDQTDAGKTFTYEVAETKGTNEAYTYDEVVRTVTIDVKDNNDGTLTVTTVVKKGEEEVDRQVVTTGATESKKATVRFDNAYEDEPATLGGEGNVVIEATKSLTNRPMEDKEFTFNVLDNQEKLVTDGTNNTEGIITFNPVEYTTDKLISDVKAGIATVDKTSNAHVYTYVYKVVEAPTPEGVTGIVTSFTITVKVTDDGNGQLTIEVVYPEGKKPLPFKNAYGTSATAEVNVNGQKDYVVESGNNEPDITGKYTFTIVGSDGAPMPDKTEVTNDAAGNVDFGKIHFTMDNVFGSEPIVTDDVEEGTVEEVETEDTMSETTDAEAADNETVGAETDVTDAEIETADVEADTTDAEIETADVTDTDTETTDVTADTADADTAAGAVTEDDMAFFKSPKRTKEFIYTVTESGEVAGVDNDPKTTRTLTVTVTDNGDGTITAVKSWEDMAFEFTNTYRVDPVEYNISTDLSIKKELSGREMKEGEFTFELVNDKNEVVATATNKADGTVTFDTALTYTAPGAYNYVIREQQGTAGGVQYDSAEHTVTVLVTDNGDGTMSAKAETKSKAEIVFKNIYETTPASVTLGASKIYNGAELKEGQFTFELKDKDGKVVSEAKNTEKGQVAFETITYDEAGTYEYTISEKNDKQENVTYDKAVYDVTVEVTDNGEGSLIAEIAYADGKAPVFTNKYTKPAEPEKPSKPEEPKKPGAVQTGDTTPIVGLVVVMVVALAAIVAVSVMFFRKRRR